MFVTVCHIACLFKLDNSLGVRTLSVLHTLSSQGQKQCLEHKYLSLNKYAVKEYIKSRSSLDGSWTQICILFAYIHFPPKYYLNTDLFMPLIWEIKTLSMILIFCYIKYKYIVCMLNFLSNGARGAHLLFIRNPFQPYTSYADEVTLARWELVARGTCHSIRR